MNKINNDPFLSNNIDSFKSGTLLEKIMIKNNVNKIIKTYRNYHKRKKELSTIVSTSTPNNTDRLQETNSFSNLINLIIIISTTIITMKI